MHYVLYGSLTSPFARRIRILLESIPYDFKVINIFDATDSEQLKKVNPVNQLPVLIDGENTILDSRQIFSYLNAIHRFQNVDWNDENLLTVIDGALNSATSLLMMKRSGINIDEPSMYVTRQRERIEFILDHLKPFITGHAMNVWDFHTMSLYCFLDWASFRELVKLDHRPECLTLLEKYRNLPIVKTTEIPKV